MSKTLKAYRLDNEVLILLDKLAKKHSRTHTNMIEVLIKEAAKKEKIKP